ncbi:hypothetical protein X975_02750, partial [Stegodyphus mimosarum]
MVSTDRYFLGESIRYNATDEKENIHKNRSEKNSNNIFRKLPEIAFSTSVTRDKQCLKNTSSNVSYNG